MKGTIHHKLVSIRIIEGPFDWFKQMLSSGKMSGISWSGSFLSGLFCGESVPSNCYSGRLTYKTTPPIKDSKDTAIFTNNILLYQGEKMPHDIDALLVGRSDSVKKNDVGIWINDRCWLKIMLILSYFGVIDFDLDKETLEFGSVVTNTLQIQDYQKIKAIQ